MSARTVHTLRVAVIALLFCWPLPQEAAAGETGSLKEPFEAAFSDSTGAFGAGAPSEVRFVDGLHHSGLKEILAGVKNLREGKVGAIIQKFAGADSNWVWNVTEARLPGHVNAVTDAVPGGTVTRLNSKTLKGATKLSVARTLIHELVHAYLILYFKHEALEAIHAYPRIVAAYKGVSPAPQLNEVHHREMAISFVPEMATALREYGRSIGLKVDDSVYWDLAWGGLDFHKNRLLDEENKQRILQRLHAEQYGAPIYSIYPVGPCLGE